MRFGHNRAVEVLASALVSGSNRAHGDLNRHIGRVAAERAFAQAGIGPDDLSVAEVHDASAYAEILQTENLGLCAAGRWRSAGRTGRDAARRAHSRSIRQAGWCRKAIRSAQPGAIQIHELVMQLRGEAGARQVKNARFAAAENGGGFFGVEEAATVVTILGRA